MTENNLWTNIALAHKANTMHNIGFNTEVPYFYDLNDDS